MTKILPAFKVDIERLRHWNGMSAAVNKLHIVPRVPRMQSIPLFFVVEPFFFYIKQVMFICLTVGTNYETQRTVYSGH